MFGNVVGQGDQDIVNSMKQGDAIHTVEIVDDPSELLETMKEFVAMIAPQLDSNF